MPRILRESSKSLEKSIVRKRCLNGFLDSRQKTPRKLYSNQRRFISEAGDKIDLVSVFIPQGFDSQSVSLPQRGNDALKTFVFAQHDDSEAPPIDISSFERVRIEIDEFGILVSRQN